MTTCPSCQATVGDSEQFCEACGAELTPVVEQAELSPAVEQTEVSPVVAQAELTPGVADAAPPPPSDERVATGPMPTDLSGTATTCPSCGGAVADDGYCGTCGARAPKRRDHFTEQPAAWVAAVCDRGIRHTRNEDAMALAADEIDAPGGLRAVLVVCDGVSNSLDSDVASLAAAQAARDLLASSHSRGIGTGPSFVAAVLARLQAATDAASGAVLEVTRTAGNVVTAGSPAEKSPVATNPASCTFVAAVVEQDLLVVGSVGDSRAYWLPDVGTAAALTLDDSFSQVQIAAGVPRAEAESGPQSHAITRWLGVDAPDHKPTTATMTLAEPGWLLVCSDGLWNYCSAATDLSALVQQIAGSTPEGAEPLALAGALVDWANAQGGQDNITVALARFNPAPTREEARRDG